MVIPLSSFPQREWRYYQAVDRSHQVQCPKGGVDGARERERAESREEKKVETKS